MRVILHFSRHAYEAIRAHLLQSESEEAAFLFIQNHVSQDGIALEVKDHYLVQEDELVGGGDSYYLELTDEARAKVIKMASDKKTALGEIHSHPFSVNKCTFSQSDLMGFKEFVPHVWWRLRGKPYVALVMGQSSFDALVWLTDPRVPVGLDSVMLDGTAPQNPTGIALINVAKKRVR